MFLRCCPENAQIVLSTVEHKAQRAQVTIAIIIILNIVFGLGYGGGPYPLICSITSFLTAAVALLAFVWLTVLIDDWSEKLAELKRELELKQSGSDLYGE